MIQSFGNRREGAGRLHRCNGFLLLRRCPTAFRFEFEPEDAALVDGVFRPATATSACGRCYGRAGRAIGDVLALASLSTSLGATAGRGSGAHNICAGHGSCARLLAVRLLAAGGPKLGEARCPSVGIGAQDERLAAKLHGTQAAGAYLLICRLTADPVGITKIFERQAGGNILASCLWWWSRSRPPMPAHMGTP